MAEISFGRVAHQEAAAFLRSKPAVAREVFDRLVPELQARAFTVSGIESVNILQNLRDRIAALPAGDDWDSIKRGLAAELSPWLGGEVAARRRAETLLRWHGYQSYQAAQYQVMDRQRDVFPYWRYESTEDGKVRPSHAALNGKILPADDPFWKTHFPPWEWGCRCRVVPLMEEDVVEVRDREQRLPPEARSLMEGDRLRQLNEGSLVTARTDSGSGRAGPPERIDVRPPQQKGRTGPAWNPGDLHIPLEDLRSRYDPDVWVVFENWARVQLIESGRTVWDWLTAGKN